MDFNKILVIRNQKLAELCGIVEAGKVEIRKLSATESGVFETIKKEIEDLDAQLEQKQNKNIIINNTRNLNTETKMTKFSLLKAIEARASGRNLTEDQLAVVDAGQNEMRKAGLSYSGDIQIPMDYRAITAGVANSGQEVVAEEKLSMLEPLRAKLVLVEAGAKFLTGLVGDVSIPTLNAVNALWKGETAAAVSGDTGTGEVTLSPKRLTAYIDISKQFLAQDSVDAEGMLMDQMVKAISDKLESTILGKAAASNSPAGMFYGKSLTVTGSCTNAKIINLETVVDTANALGTAKYITNAGGRGVMKGTAKSTNAGIFILENNEANGYPVLVTNHVAGSFNGSEYGVIFGDFSNYVIGQWGAIDLIVDATSQAINGNVRVVINAYFDAKELRSTAFAFGSIKA